MKPRYHERRWPKLEASLKKEWLAAKQAVLRQTRRTKRTNHNMSGATHV